MLVFSAYKFGHAYTKLLISQKNTKGGINTIYILDG